jgi:hypothetical protein
VAFNFCEGGKHAPPMQGEIIAVVTGENLADQQHIHPQITSLYTSSSTRHKIHDLDDYCFVNTAELYSLRNPREYPQILRRSIHRETFPLNKAARNNLKLCAFVLRYAAHSLLCFSSHQNTAGAVVYHIPPSLLP